MIEAAMMQLVKTKPFFANLLMNMTRNVTTDVPTIGVNVTDRVNLWVNPHFWDSLTIEQQVDILIHECLHVLNNHFVRFRELDPTVFETVQNGTLGDKVAARMKQDSRFKRLNAAADYAINEYLPNLPKTFNAFDSKGEIIKDADGKPLEMRPCLVSDKKGWPRFKHMELYHALIEEGRSGGGGSGANSSESSRKKKGQGDDGHGFSIDDHSLWAQGCQDEEVVLEKVKQAVNNAVEASGGMEAGSISSDVKLLIQKLNHKPKNWQNELNRFVARSSEILTESSRKVRNRRYGTIYPGSKNYPKLSLVVVVDTSASICEDTLCQFMAEIDKIHNSGALVTLIECDSEVKQVGQYDPRKKVEVLGRGGTDFGPAFAEADKHDPDALIYFTDGEDFSDNLKKPSYPVLWALLPKCKVRYNWGHKTEVSVTKKTG